MGLCSITQPLPTTWLTIICSPRLTLFFPLQEVHKSNKFTPHKTENHITNFIISCGYEGCNSQMRTSAQFLFCTDTCLHGSCNTVLYWRLWTRFLAVTLTVDELSRQLCPLLPMGFLSLNIQTCLSFSVNTFLYIVLFLFWPLHWCIIPSFDVQAGMPDSFHLKIWTQ